MSSIPSTYQKLYSSADIQGRIDVMSQDIDQWIEEGAEDGDRDVLAVPVLRGGLYFFAGLSQAVKHSLDFNPVQSWAYKAEENTALPSGVTVKITELPVKGRRVLIVDDICDSGNTLKTIHERLLDRGAKEVQAAVLIQRVGSEPTFRPKWVGFNYDGPEWFVGYGMDDGGRWRNLSDIYIVD